MLLLSGLALWAMGAINSASERAQQESRKTNVATKVDSALSELALRITGLPTATKVALEVEQVLALRKEYAAAFEEMKTSAISADDKRFVGSMEASIAPWKDLNNQIMEAAQAGKRLDAVKIREESLRRFGAVKASVAGYLAYREKVLGEIDRDRGAVTWRLTLIVIVLSLVSVLTAGIMGTFLTRSITGPLSAAVAHLDLIAGGDLWQDVPPADLERADEIGLLSKAMQTMSNSLRAVIGEINQGIGVLSSSSAELITITGTLDCLLFMTSRSSPPYRAPMLRSSVMQSKCRVEMSIEAWATVLASVVA